MGTVHMMRRTTGHMPMRRTQARKGQLKQVTASLVREHPASQALLRMLGSQRRQLQRQLSRNSPPRCRQSLYQRER